MLAGLLALANYTAGAAFLAALVFFFQHPDHRTLGVMLGLIGVFLLTSILSFLKRRNVLCPLCRGTPLLKSQAHVHAKASRLYPLGYGSSAVISMVFTQSFRCMYCGEKFDVMKSRSRAMQSAYGED